MKTTLLILKAVGIFILGIGLRLMLGDIAAHNVISDNSNNIFGFGLAAYACSVLCKALFQY